jgi:hypothetical protein
MNIPLAQKAQYYLNESNRLTEELAAHQEYSRLLEAVLEELLTEEQILQLREGIMSKIGKGLAGLAVAGACTLGSGCGSKPVEPQKTSQVMGAGAEGQADLIGAKDSAKVKAKVKVQDNRTDKQKYPTAGPEGQL